MPLLNEFGQEIKPTYWDTRDAEFVACCPGITEEIIESIAASAKYYDAMAGVRLFDGSGERINLSKPMKVSTREFRFPIQVER